MVSLVHRCHKAIAALANRGNTVLRFAAVAYGVTCGVVNPGNILVERRATSGKIEDQEPMMASADVAEVVLCMAVLPPHVEMLEAIVLPSEQDYVGRG